MREELVEVLALAARPRNITETEVSRPKIAASVRSTPLRGHQSGVERTLARITNRHHGIRSASTQLRVLAPADMPFLVGLGAIKRLEISDLSVPKIAPRPTKTSQAAGRRC